MRNTSHNVDQSFSQQIPPQKVIKITQIYPYAKVYAPEHLIVELPTEVISLYLKACVEFSTEEIIFHQLHPTNKSTKRLFCVIDVCVCVCVCVHCRVVNGNYDFACSFCVRDMVREIGQQSHSFHSWSERRFYLVFQWAKNRVGVQLRDVYGVSNYLHAFFDHFAFAHGHLIFETQNHKFSSDDEFLPNILILRSKNRMFVFLTKMMTNKRAQIMRATVHFMRFHPNPILHSLECLVLGLDAINSWTPSTQHTQNVGAILKCCTGIVPCNFPIEWRENVFFVQIWRLFLLMLVCTIYLGVLQFGHNTNRHQLMMHKLHKQIVHGLLNYSKSVYLAHT